MKEGDIIKFDDGTAYEAVDLYMLVSVSGGKNYVGACRKWCALNDNERKCLAVDCGSTDNDSFIFIKVKP